MRKSLSLTCILVLCGAGFVITACSVAVPISPLPVNLTWTPVLTEASPLSTPQDKIRVTPTSTSLSTSTPEATLYTSGQVQEQWLTNTLTPTDTQVPTRVVTPSQSPTATWVEHTAGEIIAPIFLYHHIAEGETPNRYYVSAASFRQQMGLLKLFGYITITPSQLANVLLNGGDLPAHPVIITFDDGNQDIYDFAFPIMKEYGFVGAIYIVANRLESDGFLQIDQLTEMVSAGWEVGSHSMTHPNLVQNHAALKYEILNSRLLLERKLNVKVTSFAYPFGLADQYILDTMREYGYSNGMGLGIMTKHSGNNRFYLNRRVIEDTVELSAFADLLPWR